MLKFTVVNLKMWMIVSATFIILLPSMLAQDPFEAEDLLETTVEPESSLEGNVEHLTTEDHSQDHENQVVHTTGGPIIGTTSKTVEGVEVNVYYGIPFAAPPVGPLRFKPPVRVSPWKTPFEAVNRKIPLCYQQFPNIKEAKWIAAVLGRPWTEDCLTLSVWAPKPKPQGAPVLVMIHGGAFYLGSSLMITDGTAMASMGIVVVSIGYRLGPFGFFGLGHPEAPGNVGMMDQTLALQWVQENAAAFGGDSARVTLIGVSSGGACVGFHLLSPMSKGLFSAAIILGGAPTNYWAIKEAEGNVHKSNAVLASLGCTRLNVTESVHCLRERDAEDILEAVGKPEVLGAKNELLLPTVDGSFLKEHPAISLEAGRIESIVPVIVGTAENEGSSMLATGLQNLDGRLFRRDFTDMIHKMDPKLTPLQVKALDVLYTNWSNPDDPYLLRDAARDLIGDYAIVCGVNKITDSLAKTGSTVYRYVFGHRFQFGPMKTLPWMGVIHGSDFPPILGSDNFLQVKDDEVTFIRGFRQRFVNFIRNRNPNQVAEDSVSEDDPWSEYDPRHGTYNHITDKARVRQGYRSRECRILDELLPLLTSVGKNC